MPLETVCILTAMLLPAAITREHDGVRIRVEVASNLYTWTVENLSAAPITSFAIDVYHTYDFHAPSGWELDGPMPEGTFRAWTTQADYAIRPGQSGQFNTRFTSRGAIIGFGNATIGLDDGTTLQIPQVWRPVPESARSVYLLAATLGATALLYAAAEALRARRRSAALTAG